MADRPNIVFIITDQQRVDTIAALGAGHARTPNLDRLVRRGVSFDNMFITAPSCAPSRASLFSGTYPHTNGVFRNNEPWVYSWVKDLAVAGYRTVNIGKMHTVPLEGAFGFHERHVVENKDRDTHTTPFFLDNLDKAFFARNTVKPSRVTEAARPGFDEKLGAWAWEEDESLHPDVFVGRMACWWLDRYTGDEPFFLQLGFPGPHPPYDPLPRHLDALDLAAMPLPVPEDLDAQPAALRALRDRHLDAPHDGIHHLAAPTPEQAARQRAHYHANVSLIDEQVGHVLDALQERGVLDQTVVIFTSDHGDALTDHGHSQKWTMYDPVVKVPAILCWPGQGQQDVRRDELVSLFDLGPTILDIAGVEVPTWMQARSLAPMARGEAGGRERVFCEHANDGLLAGTRMMTMVREGPHKLVHFVDSDEGQLFDLAADPDERVNLWDDVAHRDIRQRLVARILEWRTLSALDAQGFVTACQRGLHDMVMPPSQGTARGQHRGPDRRPPWP